jgi:NAD(P)H dehydrogenase (quinone)
MIIVTGATGQLGRQIVKKLVAHVATSQIGISVRDPSKVKDLEALGVRVRQGDFDNPDSLRDAFDGAHQVFVVSSNARASGDDPLAQHRNAIAAAKAAGAKRIVYTSQISASSTSAFPPAHDHAATEEMLHQSGLLWTALRHGFYASSGLQIMAEAFKTGLLQTAQDGKFSWVAHDDLAEAAAMVLTHEGKYNGPTPPFTGPEALDFGDLARIASEVTGKRIERQIIADDIMRANIAARGTPPRAVELILGLYRAARNGEFAKVDPTLEELIGRPRLTMRQLMMDTV